MDYFESFFKLHFTVRATIVGILIIMSIWYLNLFVLNEQYVSSKVFYIPIIISFVMTINWLIVNVMLGLFLTKLFLENKNAKEITTSTYQLGIFCAIIYLSIFTYFGYVFKWNFLCSTKYVFLSSGSLVIIFGGIDLFRSLRKE